MSLDKDASSDPNLKAVHAGASMRKAQHWHLQPNLKASDVADAEVGCFAFSRLAAHIRVLSKSGGKPTLPAKRSFAINELPSISLGFSGRLHRTQFLGGADLVISPTRSSACSWHHVNTPQAEAGTNVGQCLTIRPASRKKRLLIVSPPLACSIAQCK